jgi:PE-PPE domain
MGNAKHIGRVGALAVALGLGNVWHTATRMTVTIGAVVVVVIAPVVPVPASTSSPAVRLAASTECTGTTATRCALIMGTSGVPTPDDAYVENVKNRFIAPTHPGQIDYVKVTTPEGLGPFTGGLGRLVSLLGIGGDPEIFGPGGPEWDVPWWNLTGLFDLTLNQSVQAGVGDLEDAIADAMAAHPDEPLVVFGYSQSALIANRVKRNLAEQYPDGTVAPDIDFVLGGDLNLPNGGLFARFPGLYIPILDWSLNGPAPTDTQFDTVEIIRQYDFMADFPLYPLNLVADLNAVLGFSYVHTYPFDVSLAPNPTTPPPIKSQHGDTTYYYFETADLPLFGPLRTLGVPEAVIDVVEPFFKVLVELGYDRSIPPGEPTPARLIPPLNPGTVTADLVNAIGEGVHNAVALFGGPVPLSSPTPAAITDQDAAMEQQSFSRAGTPLQTISHEAGDGVSRVLTADNSQLPETLAVSQDDPQASQRKVSREPAATNDPINETIGAVKSVVGNGRTIVRSASSDNGSRTATASPARKTPVRDAVKNASTDITKIVTKVSDGVKQALNGGNDDDDTGDGGEGAAP